MVYVIIYQHVPVERCVQLVADLPGGTGPSAGFVHGMLSRCAAALAEVVKLIKTAVRLAAVAGFDETTIRCGPAGQKKYIGLDPIARPARDQRRRDHITGHPHRRQQPVQLKPARPGLITGPQHPGIAEPADQMPYRAFLIPDPVHHRDLLTRHQDARHDRVLRGVHSQMDQPRR